MKKYRKCHMRKARKTRNNRARTRNLRGGSKEAKAKLLELNPHCDICGKKGTGKTLQLHHVFCIRWGFATRLERCVLLCPTCHHDFHKKYDKYLDEIYRTDHGADFLQIYNTIKGSLN